MAVFVPFQWRGATLAMPATEAPAPAADPSNVPSPKVKIPPSRATSQYPWPDGVVAMPTIGWLRRVPASDPRFGVLPTGITAPRLVAAQARAPPGAAATATTASPPDATGPEAMDDADPNPRVA